MIVFMMSSLFTSFAILQDTYSHSIQQPARITAEVAGRLLYLRISSTFLNAPVTISSTESLLFSLASILSKRRWSNAELTPSELARIFTHLRKVMLSCVCENE